MIKSLSALLAELVRPPEIASSGWAGPSLGTTLGRFELLQELGRGGFGVVYEARDLELGRLVALKVIRPGSQPVAELRQQRLRMEAKAVALLAHPNIVTLYDIGDSEYGPYLILERLHGETLQERLVGGPLAPKEAIRITVEIARAIAHAHAAGILHRDLKPSNVFLTSSGGVKVLDFGLAYLFDGKMAERSGTPAYMAPEQWRAEYEDSRVDVFGLGVMLFEMLTAYLPYEVSGGRSAVLEIDSTPKRSLPELPPVLNELIVRALSPKPEARPLDGQAVLEALLSVDQSSLPAEKVASNAIQVAAAHRRGLGRWGWLLLGGLFFACVAGWYAFERRRETVRRREAVAITSSLEAYEHYLASQRCMDQVAFGHDCAEELEKALAIDPTFALAHYQLAVWLSERGGSLSRQRTAIESAVRHADRVPARDRALILAWKLHFDGKDEVALEAYREMIAAHPEERQPLYEAGDLYHHRSEFAAAAPFFERLLALDPSHGWALDHWIEDLGGLGRRDELERLANRLRKAQPTVAVLHALSVTSSWLGDYEGARSSARRLAEFGGGLTALQDLLYASVFAGRYDEMRGALEELAVPSNPARSFGCYALAALDAYRGKRGNGWARFAMLQRSSGDEAADALFYSLRSDYLLGDGDVEAVRREALRLLALDPVVAAGQAINLAYLGDLDHAARFTTHLRLGSVRERTYRALVLWHQGEQARAIEQLRQLARHAPFDVDRGLAPSFLLGELASRAGRDAEAVEALSHFQSLFIPTAMWRSWAYPRSLYLMSVSLERLGRLSEAMERVDQLLAGWREADPDLPLMRDAHSLRRRLMSRGAAAIDARLSR